MLIRDGNIEAVGPSDEIERALTDLIGQSRKERDDVEIVDASGRVVLPGFVDAHTHLVFGGNRLDDFERRAKGETYNRSLRRGRNLVDGGKNARDD